jgi:hypothetical protein
VNPLDARIRAETFGILSNFRNWLAVVASNLREFQLKFCRIIHLLILWIGPLFPNGNVIFAQFFFQKAKMTGPDHFPVENLSPCPTIFPVGNWNMETESTTKPAQLTPKARGHRILILYVTIVTAVLTSIAGLKAYRRHLHRAEDEKFFRDVMIIQEALSQYASETDPAATVNRKLSPTVSGTASDSSAIAGKWRIKKEESQGREITSIVLENPKRNLREMESLDAKLDDGNLSSGPMSLKGKESYSIEILESRSEENLPSSQ